MKATFFLAALAGASSTLASNCTTYTSGSVVIVTGTASSGIVTPTSNGTYTFTPTVTSSPSPTGTIVSAGAAGLGGAQAVFGAVAAVAAAVLVL